MQRGVLRGQRGRRSRPRSRRQPAVARWPPPARRPRRRRSPLVPAWTVGWCGAWPAGDPTVAAPLGVAGWRAPAPQRMQERRRRGVRGASPATGRCARRWRRRPPADSRRRGTGRAPRAGPRSCRGARARRPSSAASRSSSASSARRVAAAARRRGDEHALDLGHAGRERAQAAARHGAVALVDHEPRGAGAGEVVLGGEDLLGGHEGVAQALADEREVLGEQRAATPRRTAARRRITAAGAGRG